MSDIKVFKDENDECHLRKFSSVGGYTLMYVCHDHNNVTGLLCPHCAYEALEENRGRLVADIIYSSWSCSDCGEMVTGSYEEE